MRRLFLSFPDGVRGFGLLLLRATVGLAAIIQGVSWLGSHNGNATWLAGVLGVVSGAFLIAGFFALVSALTVALGAVCVAFSWLPSSDATTMDTRTVSGFVVIVVAVVLVGPGAFSVDSFLFGRREIIVPPTSRLPK